MNRRSNHVHSSKKVRAWALAGWLAMALVFGFTGWLFAVKPIAFAVGNWFQTRDYQLTPATVEKRIGKDAEGTFDWYVAQYRVGNRTHETSRLTILDNEDIDEPTNERVQKTMEKAFGEKRPIEVWVSPRKAHIAVVNRDFPFGSLWTRVPMAIGFAIFALAGVMGMLGCIGNFVYYRRMVDAAGPWFFSAAWCGFTFPMLILAGGSGDGGWVAVVVLGLFSLVGCLVLWAAIAVSLYGARTEAGDKVAVAASANLKRRGFGGRGDDFDKD